MSAVLLPPLSDLPAPRPLSRAEYDQLVAGGAFEDEKLELLWGMLIPMSPQKEPHSWVIEMLSGAFWALAAGRFTVRVQMPLAVSDWSEPEPDIALIAPRRRTPGVHVGTAMLVVEVAQSSQRRDRRKLAIYAEAGIPEAWIFDVAAEQVEIYRDPSGDRYQTVITVGRGHTVSLGSLPDVTVSVDAILDGPSDDPAPQDPR